MMKPRINYIITFILLLSSFSLMAQRPSMEEIKAKLRADKVAYLTTRIALTPSEAEKFWPVYNEFDDKRIDIQMERFNLDRKVMRSKESLTDEEIVKFIQDSNNSKREEEELNVKYYEKFLKLIPPKKVLTLYQVEKEYINYLNMRNRGGRNNF